eukprot:1140244-Pelagomonas_calceolata.AAC.4
MPNQLCAEKFTSEVDVDRQKFELLLAEKNEQEMEYEEKLKQAEERSQVQLAALDTQYQMLMPRQSWCMPEPGAFFPGITNANARPRPGIGWSLPLQCTLVLPVVHSMHAPGQDHGLCAHSPGILFM